MIGSLFQFGALLLGLRAVAAACEGTHLTPQFFHAKYFVTAESPKVCHEAYLDGCDEVVYQLSTSETEVAASSHFGLAETSGAGTYTSQKICYEMLADSITTLSDQTLSIYFWGSYEASKVKSSKVEVAISSSPCSENAFPANDTYSVTDENPFSFFLYDNTVYRSHVALQDFSPRTTTIEACPFSFMVLDFGSVKVAAPDFVTLRNHPVVLAQLETATDRTVSITVRYVATDDFESAAIPMKAYLCKLRYYLEEDRSGERTQLYKDVSIIPEGEPKTHQYITYPELIKDYYEPLSFVSNTETLVLSESAELYKPAECHFLEFGLYSQGGKGTPYTNDDIAFSSWELGIRLSSMSSQLEEKISVKGFVPGYNERTEKDGQTCSDGCERSLSMVVESSQKLCSGNLQITSPEQHYNQIVVKSELCMWLFSVETDNPDDPEVCTSVESYVVGINHEQYSISENFNQEGQINGKPGMVCLTDTNEINFQIIREYGIWAKVANGIDSVRKSVKIAVFEPLEGEETCGNIIVKDKASTITNPSDPPVAFKRILEKTTDSVTHTYNILEEFTFEQLESQYSFCKLELVLIYKDSSLEYKVGESSILRINDTESLTASKEKTAYVMDSSKPELIDLYISASSPGVFEASVIHWTLCVCGNEQVVLSSGNENPKVVDLTQNSGNTFQTSVANWFSVNIPAGLSDSDCVITSIKVFTDVGGQTQSDSSWISISSSNELEVTTASAVTFNEVFIGAQTKGQVFASRRMLVTVSARECDGTSITQSFLHSRYYYESSSATSMCVRVWNAVPGSGAAARCSSIERYTLSTSNSLESVTPSFMSDSAVGGSSKYGATLCFPITASPPASTPVYIWARISNGDAPVLSQSPAIEITEVQTLPCGSEKITGNQNIDIALEQTMSSEEQTLSFLAYASLASSMPTDCPVDVLFQSASLDFSDHASFVSFSSSESELNSNPALQISVDKATPQKYTKFFKALTQGDVESDPFTFSVTVCGNEEVILASADPVSVRAIQHSDSSKYFYEISKADYISWFSMDYSHSDTSTNCIIKSYGLYSDAEATSEWTGSGQEAIAYIKEDTGSIIIPFVKEATTKVYLAAFSMSKKKAVRAIDITVYVQVTCGEESISILKQASELVLDRLSGATSKDIDLKASFEFETNDLNCPISTYDLALESGGGDALGSLPASAPLLTYSLDPGHQRLYLTAKSKGNTKLTLSFEVYVCGRESLSPKSQELVALKFAPSTGSTQQIPVAEHFTFDNSASDTHSSCIIHELSLFEDSALTQAYSGPVQVQGTSLKLNINSPIEPFKVFWKVITSGMVIASSELQLTVCGFEIVSKSADPAPFIFTVGAKGVLKTVKLNEEVSFSSTSEVCSVETFEKQQLYPANGGVTSSLPSSENIPVEFSLYEPQYKRFEFAGTTIAGTRNSAFFDFVVCGREQVGLHEDHEGEFTIALKYDPKREDQSDLEISKDEFVQWFTVTSQVTEEALFENCGIVNFVFCDDEGCKAFAAVDENVKLDSPTTPTMNGVLSPQLLDHFDLTILETPTDPVKVTYKIDRIYSFEVYLAAVTKGYIFGTRKLIVKIECGLEELSLDSDQPFIFTSPLGQGSRLLLFNTYSRFFLNTAPDRCPVRQYGVTFQEVIEKDTEKKIRGSILSADPSQQTNATEIKVVEKAKAAFFAQTGSNDYLLQTNTFIGSGNYSFEFEAVTAGKISLSKTILVQVLPKSEVNFPPEFKEPLTTIQVDMAEVGETENITYSSPPLIDAEDNNPKVQVSISSGDHFISYDGLQEGQLKLSINGTGITDADVRAHPIIITLSDDATDLSSTEYWYVQVFKNGIEEEDQVIVKNETTTVTTNPGDDSDSSGSYVPVTKPEWQTTVSQLAFNQQLEKWLAEQEAIKNAEEEVRPFRPTVPEMSRDGTFWMRFSRPLKVPSFIIPSKPRMLQETGLFEAGSTLDEDDNESSLLDEEEPVITSIPLQDIDVTRDLMDVRFLLRSSIEPEDIEYYLGIEEWTEEGVKFFFNFTNPALISQGNDRDLVEFIIRERKLFVAADTNEVLNKAYSKVWQTIPRQLPKGLKEDDIASNAKSATQALESMAYIQLTLQIMLRGTLDDLATGFYCLQVSCYMTLYNVPFPSVTEIFVDHFRRVIEFDLLKPERVLEFFNANSTMREMFGIKAEFFSGPIESSGVTTSDFLFSLRTFILIIVIFGVFMFGLFFVALFKSRLQSFAKKQLDKQITNLQYNTPIRGLTISYLQITISVFVTLQAFANQGQDFFSLAQSTVLVAYVFGYPIGCTVILFWKRNFLHEEATRNRMKNLYRNIHLTREDRCLGIYFYSAFLIRRLLFTLIPFSLMSQRVVQLQLLLALNLVMIWFVGWTSPFEMTSQIVVELANEFIIMVLTYHLVCFIEWRELGDQLHLVGQSFIFFLFLIVAVNVGHMLRNLIYKCQSKYRQMKNQKAYEQAFNAWLDRQAMLKEERRRQREEKRRKREVEQSESWNSFLQLNFEGLSANDEVSTAREEKKEDILDSILGYNPWSVEDDTSQKQEAKKKVEEEEYDLEEQFARNVAHSNYFAKHYGKKKKRGEGEEDDDEDQESPSPQPFLSAMLDYHKRGAVTKSDYNQPKEEPEEVDSPTEPKKKPKNFGKRILKQARTLRLLSATGKLTSELPMDQIQEEDEDPVAEMPTQMVQPELGILPEVGAIDEEKDNLETGNRMLGSSMVKHAEHLGELLHDGLGEVLGGRSTYFERKKNKKKKKKREQPDMGEVISVVQKQQEALLEAIGEAPPVEDKRSKLEQEIESLQDMMIELEEAKRNPQSSLEKYLKINPQEAFQETKLSLADLKSLMTEINKAYGALITPKDLREKRKKYKRHARVKIMASQTSWEAMEEDFTRDQETEFDIMIDSVCSKLEELQKKREAEAQEEEEQKILDSAAAIEAQEEEEKDEEAHLQEENLKLEKEAIEVSSNILGQVVPDDDESDSEDEEKVAKPQISEQELERKKTIVLSQLSSLPLPGETRQQHQERLVREARRARQAREEEAKKEEEVEERRRPEKSSFFGSIMSLFGGKKAAKPNSKRNELGYSIL